MNNQSYGLTYPSEQSEKGMYFYVLKWKMVIIYQAKKIYLSASLISVNSFLFDIVFLCGSHIYLFYFFEYSCSGIFKIAR